MIKTKSSNVHRHEVCQANKCRKTVVEGVLAHITADRNRAAGLGGVQRADKNIRDLEEGENSQKVIVGGSNGLILLQKAGLRIVECVAYARQGKGERWVALDVQGDEA